MISNKNLTILKSLFFTNSMAMSENYYWYMLNGIHWDFFKDQKFVTEVGSRAALAILTA